MKKSHGPSLKATPTPLKWCLICKGKAVTKGVFHELPCTECHASGWVSAETGEALPVEILVTQLGLMLNIYQQRIIAFGNRLNQQPGEQQQYNENNRRGAGGTNFTGD
ncbi:hypothetical protein [Pseudomonas sp. 1 R 17]|uniref:hypothetical protein n=1 Tax=Pseudomonas sp. 1 R 17 TaxID=1844091 RepID=UPI000812A03C|nr:hypothetical protein [Pseudomonas sp. 1 R 17]SAM35778.1 hypothetical protein BN1864_LIB5394:05825 [Pseudomonas sp. 1 R 17]